MRKVKKLIGSLLGSITAGAVMAVAAALGVTIEAELAAAIVTIAAAVGTYLSPKNEENAT